ncbi:MAG: MBL fold metallo-hydrolase [Betaproteobacteria bacterium]
MNTPPSDLVFYDRGWLSSNSLLMLGKQTTLVDSGHFSHAPLLKELLNGALERAPLHSIINTHLHSDHCGGNAHLQSCFPALDIRIPSGEWREVLDWSHMERTNEGIGQSCPAFKATSQITPNTEICVNDRVWEVHAAPGHDMEAILLFAPLEKILISGDAFWENGFGVVFPELSQEEGFKHVRDTLSLIDDLEPRLVVPGHGRMFTQVKDSLNLAHQKLDYFESNPLSHAKYASNVFVKFKLMQEQRMSFSALKAWAVTCPVLIQTQEHFFPHVSFHAWLNQIINDLALKKSIAVQGQVLLNL